jgi:leucyl aminopeptidase
MTGTTVTTSLAQIEAPLLAIAVAQGAAVPASLAELDRAAGGMVGRAITSGDFKGKRDETALLYPDGAKPQRLLLVGLGKPVDVTRNSVRRAAAVAAKRARALGATQFAFAIAAEARNGVAAADVGQVVVEGAAQGAWAFTELKAAPDDPKAEVEAVAVACETKEAQAVAAGERLGEAIAAGHFLTRYLQMLPGNVCTPSYLADRAKQLADQHGFGCTVLDRAQMREENMGALLAVAQGSQQEPRFIVLEHRGAGAADAPVALVGKGVTFDSGGISIKPAQNMEDMKFDMSGAAAVLGTFEALGRLKPRLNVVGLIPATENLPSGTAVKPGDVVKSHLGKTIEIINTDAEGRLILCDALSYARRFKPAGVIDIATLTGAVVVALGQVAIGMMGNDDALLAEVREAGERAGERCWPLPLWDEYRDLLKSDIADMKNSGGRGAGSIAGGWFLREFVEGIPWVHLDIAGTAYTEGEGPHQVKGPTAVGVRLFTEFILKRAGA